MVNLAAGFWTMVGLCLLFLACFGLGYCAGWWRGGGFRSKNRAGPRKELDLLPPGWDK